MRYFTSDLHFFHNLVLKKYRSDTCMDLSTMHEYIVHKWNKQVKSKDIVYILGDLSFGKFEETKEIISRLNRKKLILIRGNHDERFTTKQLLDMGFDEVFDTYVIKVNGEKLILSHYPYSSSFKFFFYKWFKKSRSEANYYKLYLPFKGYKLIHGHHHSQVKDGFSQFNVAWDVRGRLVGENELTEGLDTSKLSKLRILWEQVKLVFF